MRAPDSRLHPCYISRYMRWLITLTGQDRPGITSSLLSILEQHKIPLLDLGQAVTQGALSLALNVEAPKRGTWSKALEAQAKKQKLDFKFEEAPHALPKKTAPTTRYAVTLLAPQLGASCLAEVTKLLARSKANIDRIRRLSDGTPLRCLELAVSLPTSVDPQKLTVDLVSYASRQGVDVGVQREGIYRRSKRLVVMDMDSTLIQAEVIDELARERGCYDQVSAITHEAMAGKISYDESLKRRCEKLTGLTQQQLEKVRDRVPLTAGARELIGVLKRLGYRIAIISGGFTFVADRLREQLGVDYAYANQLEMRGGKATGKVLPPIVNAQRKADLLETLAQQERISLEQVVAIGDGANDLLMLERAGLGIAFNAKPLVREKADLSLSQPDLRNVLHLLGLSDADIREALDLF